MKKQELGMIRKTSICIRAVGFVVPLRFRLVSLSIAWGTGRPTGAWARRLRRRSEEILRGAMHNVRVLDLRAGMMSKYIYIYMQQCFIECVSSNYLHYNNWLYNKSLVHSCSDCVTLDTAHHFSRNMQSQWCSAELAWIHNPMPLRWS